MAADVTGNIRAKIAAGLLPVPTEPPDKIWVGKGTGEACDACDQPITDDTLEYEIDLPAGRILRFHHECLAAWHRLRSNSPSG